jgi:hypothetical protein
MAARDTHATIEELLEIIFYVWPMPRAYKENQLPVHQGNKYRNPALQVGGVSKIETIKFAHKSRWTQI